MKHKPRTPAITATIATVLCLGLITSCSNNNEHDDFHETLDTAETEPLTSETAEASTTSSSSMSSSTSSSTSTTVAEEVDSDYDTLDELWQELLTATGLPVDERTPALEAIETLDEDVIETAATLLFERDAADAYTYPVYEPQPDGTINIQDCTIYQPGIWNSATHLHTATAQPNGNGTWAITRFERQTPNCVPAELAQGAIDGYIAYFEAGPEYYNPPDPDHPAIEATLTGELLDLLPERLAEVEADGEYFVELDTIYPEVTDVFAPDRILISDCRGVDPATGLYNASDQQIARTPGERNLYLVEMQLTSDGWRAASFNANYIDDCTHAPSPIGKTLI